MPKKIEFKHKIELQKIIKQNSMKDVDIIQYFKDTHRIQITAELLEKTKAMVAAGQGRKV